MSTSRTTHAFMQRQRGAAFIVMLVILIMGVTAFLISALSKVTLQNARNEKSSDMLAQAKEVAIGNAVTGIGGQRPGDILRPDSFASTEIPPDYDGTAETGCLDVTQPSGLPLTANTTNMRCLGRLPWKDYKLSIASPSENDPTGYMPWYAVSTNMVDPAGVAFNSELLNASPPPHPWLTVRDMSGNVLSNRVAFIIFIPGAPLSGQSRPTSPNLGGANQYLDSITVPASCTAPCVPGPYSNADMDNDFIMGDEHRWIADPANPGNQIEDPNYSFNDKLLYVTIDELMPLIEKRIAREAKSCLDNYAAVSASKYPWAAPVSDLTYTSTNSPPTLFGRIPTLPTINSPLNPGNASDTKIQALFSAMSALNTAVQNCLVSDSFSNQAALANAGDQLVTAANNVAGNQPTMPAISSTATNFAITAGNRAQTVFRCTKIENGTSTTVQTNLSSAYTTLGGVMVPEDPSMQISWPVGCFVPGSYWDDWKNLIFYQVANGYQPNGSLNCAPNCLTINGSGNTNSGSGTYRASVVLAGKMLTGQTPRNATVLSNYLELSNQTNKTIATPTTIFETYRLTDPNYPTVNDLVMCLDGKGTNPGSVCQ